MSSEVIQSLEGTLSHDPNARLSSELRLGQLLALSETGQVLSSIALSQELDIGAACISLRTFVNERWSPYFSSFKGPAAPISVKAQIRTQVMHGLSDTNSKIRTLLAQVLSTFAHSDWPDDYPELLSNLIALLSSGSGNGVHGAMQVFVEFVKSDVTEDQILPALRELLPALMTILTSPDHHSATTRARSIKVFQQCVEYLYMVKDQHSLAVKEATSSILPYWIAAFYKLLQAPAPSEVASTDNWDGLAIHVQIYRTLNIIYSAFPSSLMSLLPELLHISRTHLDTLVPIFNSYYIAGSNDPPISSEDVDAAIILQLAATILDFMCSLSRGAKAKVWFSDSSNLNSLVYTVCHWTQITHDDEETWYSDANAFLRNEDENNDAVGPRIAGFDLIGSVLERWLKEGAAALQQCTNKILLSSDASKQAGHDNWWRPVEAALACCTANADALLELLDDERTEGGIPSFDPIAIITVVIPSVLQLQECPLLLARSLIYASKFCSLLTTDLARRYALLSVEVIESDSAALPVKLSAVKAIQNIFENYRNQLDGDETRRAAEVLGRLVLLTSEDTLCVVLETMATVLKVQKGEWLSIDFVSSLGSAFLKVWSQNPKDPVLNAVIEDNFQALGAARAKGVSEVITSLIIPALCQAISAAGEEESWISTSALDFITTLAKGDAAKSSPTNIFETLGPTLFICLQSVSDRDVLQAGVICLTQFIRMDISQILNWNGFQGVSGLDHVLALLARLLDPSEDEIGGLVVGDLIIHLFRGGGEALSPLLPTLLQAIIRRMTTAKTASLLQSLLIPFSLLLQTQRDWTLQLLESTEISAPSSANPSETRNALAILLQTWCENAETIQGLWPSRMSTLAICQLFISERSSVQQVLVKGDIIMQAETKDVIITRSRAKRTPHQFSVVPFPVRALKLLLGELQSAGDAAVDDHLNVDSDDGDDEWADEDEFVPGFKQDEFALLSDMLGPQGMSFENDEMAGHEYDDFEDFPVGGMDMAAHLTSFLKECRDKNTNNFLFLTDYLSAEETVVLQNALRTT